MLTIPRKRCNSAFRGLPRFSLGLLSRHRCWWQSPKSQSPADETDFVQLDVSVFLWCSVFFVNFVVFTEHQDVIEETHSMLLSCNDLFHGALENLWRRCNALWQSAVEVSAKWTDECSEFGWFIVQWNLPKSTRGIQLGKDGGSLQFVKDVFNCRYDRSFTLDCSVQLFVVSADPHPTVFLWYYHNTCAPVCWLLYLLYDARFFHL